MPTFELLRWGATSRGLTRAVNAGLIIRARQGWYVLPELDVVFTRAIRVGGRLASVSAASTYGLATPHSFPLHVHVPRAASRLRTEYDRFIRMSSSPESTTVIHRDQVRLPTTATRLRVSLIDCLVQVIKTESEDDAVACLDSAAHSGILDTGFMSALRARLPTSRLPLLGLVDGRSEVYPESVIRTKLARAGIVAVPQVEVLGERRIDLLIGDRLALEIDGVGKFTAGLSTEEIGRRLRADCLRTAFLEALGYHVIHLSYEMIVFDWPATLAMIEAVIERGDHLSSTRTR